MIERCVAKRLGRYSIVMASASHADSLVMATSGNSPTIENVSLGQAGKAAVTEQFAPNTMVDTIETVYQNLTKVL